MALALVLAPEPVHPDAQALDWRVDAGSTTTPATTDHPVSAALASHGMAAALPLLEALALAQPGPVALPLDPGVTLHLRLAPPAPG